MDILTKQIQVQYAITATTPAWLDAGLVDVSNNATYIGNVVSGTPYNFRIRSVRANGAVSVWTEIDNYVVSTTMSTITSTGINPNSPFNVSNNATIDSIVESGAATIRIYGPGGDGSSFTRYVGAVASTMSGAHITGEAFAYTYYVVYDTVGLTYLAFPNYNSTLSDTYIPIGSVITCDPSYTTGTGGGTAGGGGVGGNGGRLGVLELSSTSYLSNADKIALVAQWNAEAATQTSLDALAVTWSVSHSAYDAAVALISSTLVTAGAPSNWTTAWPDGKTSGPWAGIQTSLSNLWASVATQRSALQSNISASQAAAAQSAAVATSVTNTAASIATTVAALKTGFFLGKWWNGTSASWFPAGGGDLSSAPVAVTTDQNINYVQGSYTWPNASPVPSGVNATYTYARWTGYVTVGMAGVYSFGVSSDDGANLYVNGTALVSNLPTPQGTYMATLNCSQSGAITLSAGQTVPIILEWQNGGGGGGIQLIMTPPGQANQLVMAGTTPLPGSSITAGTITSNSIAAGTITAGNIASGTITATQIAAGTITSSQIAANTITAGNISSAYVYAGNLTANQITTGTLNGSSINVTNLNATNITTGTLNGAVMNYANNTLAHYITSAIASGSTGVLIASDGSLNPLASSSLAQGNVTTNGTTAVVWGGYGSNFTTGSAWVGAYIAITNPTGPTVYVRQITSVTNSSNLVVNASVPALTGVGYQVWGPFGWSVTASATTDVFNINVAVSLYLQSSGLTNYSVGVSIDGAAATNVSVYSSLPSGALPYFTSITGLSAGTHTILIVGGASSGISSSTQNAMIQRIY